jgi:hypothetical protein
MLNAIASLLDPAVVTPFAQAFSSNIYISGILMILLNTGTSYLMQDIMPLANRVFSVVWMRRLVFFAIFFTATRHLWISLLLTLMFTVLVDVLLNEKSPYCLLPYEWREIQTTTTQQQQQQQQTSPTNTQIETFVGSTPGAITSSRNANTPPVVNSPISRREHYLQSMRTWNATRSLRPGIQLSRTRL